MLKKEELKTVKKEAKRFFEKMGFKINLKSLTQQDETLSVKMEAKNPQVLIGREGRILSDAQRLLGAILKRKIQEKFFLDIDVNNYKVQKTKFLKDLAQKTADQVVLTKEEMVLNPMSAYERRIIHLELSGRGEITTESMGREPERRVVVRPYP